MNSVNIPPEHELLFSPKIDWVEHLPGFVKYTKEGAETFMALPGYDMDNIDRIEYDTQNQKLEVFLRTDTGTFVSTQSLKEQHKYINLDSFTVKSFEKGILIVLFQIQTPKPTPEKVLVYAKS